MKKLNVVITAGGTSEPIDKVRKITNSGTGRLGKIIAEKLLENENINIYYICSKKALRPSNERVSIIEIETVNELKKEVETLLTNTKIDYFIHSMAVSDYYVDYVTTSNILANELNISPNLEETIINPQNKLDNTSKISSNEENLIVMLKKAPKVIELIKKLSPETKLIGFKLLENVTKEELLKVAINLKDKNNCDYVVANDLKNITKDTHEAFIIDKNNNYKQVFTKLEIAQKIKELK